MPTYQWTAQQKNTYAAQHQDSAHWDRKMLEEDKTAEQQMSWPTRPAMRYLPSPVATYSSPGGSLRSISMEIGGKAVCGYSIAWGKGDFNAHLFSEGELVHTYFNILVLTDQPNKENWAARIVSRNHPHYLASGKHTTSIGPVDWLHTALATGQNQAVVSMRFFDLTLGRTILVAPQKDGTLRFLQLPSEGSHFNGFDTYLAHLGQNPQVVQFFTASGTIK